MFVRGLAGAIIGALTGAGAAALTFGLDTSLDVGSSFIGPTRDWWLLAAIFGALGGAVVGSSLGLYITLSRVGRGTALIVACLIGGFGALVLIFINGDRYSWHLRSLPARVIPLVVSVLSWALIGLFISVIAGKLPRPR